LRLRKAERVLFQELEFHADDLSKTNSQLLEPSVATAESSAFRSNQGGKTSDEAVPIVFHPDTGGQWQGEVGSWEPPSRGAILSRPFSNQAQPPSTRDSDEIIGESPFFTDEVFQQPDMPSADIFSHDIDAVLMIQNPPRSLMLAGAAILILLTEGTEVPADISWDAFREMASIDDIAWDMNSLIPSNIPRFKVRAIRPFMSHLENFVADRKSTPGGSYSRADASTMKIVKWVTTLMAVAVREVLSESPKKSIPSKTDKLLASVSSADVPILSSDRKKNSKIPPENKKVPQRTKPLAKSALSEPAKEKALPKVKSKLTIANKKITKIPKLEKNMCTLYSELVDNIFERPLFLTLLGPSFLLSDDIGNINSIY